MHKIQFKTGLERSTIGRIEKKADLDEENYKNSYPSKFSSYNKQSIIWKSTTEKLDNAILAIHFINDWCCVFLRVFYNILLH